MIKDFDGPFQLVYEMELDSNQYENCYPEVIERNLDDILLFEDATKLAGLEDDQDDLYFEVHPSFAISHPVFEKPIELGTTEDMAKFWEHAVEAVPEYEEAANYWMRKAERREYDRRLLEDRVNCYCDEPDILKNAGIISASESKTMSRYRPDLRVLHALMSSGKLPPNIELMFLGGRLCINSVPTRVFEEDCRDLYNGYLGFRTPEESLQHVVELVEEKLLPLFGEVIKEVQDE
jgi:hypothetical protein